MCNRLVLAALVCLAVGAGGPATHAVADAMQADASASGGNDVVAIAQEIDSLKYMVLGVIVIVMALLAVVLWDRRPRTHDPEEDRSEPRPKESRNAGESQFELIPKRLDQMKAEIVSELGRRLSGIENRLDSPAKVLEEAARKIDRVTDSVANESRSLHQRLEALDQELQQSERRKMQLDATKQELETRENQLLEKESRHKDELLDFQREKEREARRREQEREEIGRFGDELKSQEKRLESQAAAIESEKEAATQARAELTALTKQYERFVSELWPPVFVDGQLAEWRSEIEKRLAEPESVAKHLWLAIGKYHAHILKKEAKELPRALVDLGKSVYRFWAEIGLDPSAQSRAAQEWASVLESEIGGGYKLRIAEPGLPKDPAWMAFGMMSGNSCVHEVQGWCVLDSKNFPVEKANVA